MYILQRLSIRIKHILIGVFCAFASIALYLFHLQITQSTRFSRLSRNNFTRTEKIASSRGNITDQHGALLATNRPVYTIYWQGTGNQKLTAEQQQIIRAIETLNLMPNIKEDHLSSSERYSKKIKLAHDISFTQLAQLLEQVPSNSNLHIKQTYERCYPHNNLASHILGYLCVKDDSSGKMGLERLYNKKLQGEAGTLLTITNAIGRPVTAHTVVPASAGLSVRTTLDLSLQRIAEELFPAEYDGCLLLMDSDGGLDVVLSRPSFEPTIFLKPLTHEQWHLLQKNNAFVNRAFSGCYPPASLFKLVTLAAALETKLITPKTTWDCTGYTDFKGRHYHCNNRWGHGTVSTLKAFAMSCNIPFYDIGKQISIDTLAHYAHVCGLGSKTGILFPEQQGLVPTTTWKKLIRREPWWPGETLSAVIGQSSLLVTPLQMACLLNTLCTGYRVRPRILADEPITHEPVDMNPTTLHFLQECLHSVIATGTGTILNTLKGFTIRGKSGTAQVRSLTGRSLTKEQSPHGYFVAHFQYLTEKPKTLVILLEHAGSSKHAIKLAYTFLSRYTQRSDLLFTN